MKILVLNQDWFCEEWRAAGHEVVSAGFAEHLDIRLEIPLLHVDRIVQQRPGFVPDRIVVHDNSGPILVSGLEETEVPTLFYSVDSHHHAEVHRLHTKLFDRVCCAQSDYIPQLESLGERVEWLPLWASRFIEASEEKRHRAVFVGNLNVKLNPERVAFFDALRASTEVECMHGRFWEIFPFAEIVMNQTVKGDLNFRVFEAMMSGAVLLTERSGNGLLDLFEDGKHFVLYEKNDVEDAAGAIRELLADTERARRIGRAGRDEILARHLPVHRAERVMSILEGLERRVTGMRNFAAAFSYEITGRKLRSMDTGAYLQSCAQCLKAATRGAEEGEELIVEVASSIIAASICYDLTAKTGAGAALVESLASRYPASDAMALAAVRSLLNRGAVRDAETLASRFHTDSPGRVYSAAEEFVNDLMRQVVDG